MQHHSKPNDLQVLADLDELEYPASKQDVIREAEARGASQNFVEDLQALDRVRFADQADLEAALRDGPRLA